MISALRPIWRELLICYYEQAMREIHKLHPDVPYITYRLHQLRQERRVKPARTQRRVVARAWKWL